MRLLAAALAACALAALPGTARAAECAKNAAGKPFATGNGKNNPKAETKGKARLGAERAAFFDALSQLKDCLGDQAKGVTGWTVADVRYFDSDPIVEVDVAASFEPAPQVTVLGSAVPNLDKGDANVKKVRLDTQRAATAIAQRNAKEALDVVFPDGSEGETRSQLAGSLGACQVVDINYWSDQAVSVKVTCGKDVKAAPATGHDAPALQKHDKK
jgi:hypothetical protein